MGTTTLSVNESTLERFKEQKGWADDAQPNSPDHTADSFLNALLDTWERVGEIPEGGPEAITDALSDEEVAIIGTEAAVVDDLAERIGDPDALEGIRASVETVETRTGRIERQLEELQG